MKQSKYNPLKASYSFPYSLLGLLFLSDDIVANMLGILSVQNDNLKSDTGKRNYVKPKTNNRLAPITAFLTFRYTYRQNLEE